MKLKLVKQEKFLGTVCDFYMNESNEIFMSRTQIGYALKYKDPSNAIKRIHMQYKERLDKFSIEVTGVQFIPPQINNKNNRIYMYTERGIYDICRKSRQSVADDFYDYVYEVVNGLRINGFYIAIGKDDKWLGVRKDSKATRREFTDEIQEFVYYAIQQGSHKPEMYYIHFTKLVNEKLGIPKGTKREDLNQSTLLDIMAIERVMSMKLPKLINKEMPYKDVYKEIKKLISII
ncbi:BRO family protein [Clostridium sp. HBUAS56017]|uniref:BRO family protein n=1 Tax=Clostridium sp. HBUAS56017 TaxID=2571128 RepID=UPI00117750AB|nr:BRO family protein [Clostridium sp. HBUAS56017]